MTQQPRRIDLSTLAEGMGGLTPAKGQALAEAAEVCLDHNQHQPGVQLTVTGHLECSRPLLFNPPTEQARCTYDDLQEATEAGACAVAIVVVCSETGLHVVLRSRKRTGIDYWLGRSRGVFEARLEVSGILAGTDAQVGLRTKKKLQQTKQSDASAVPAYAAVVEFSHPRVHVERR